MIDVESVGLHGPGFAVGFCLADYSGYVTNEGIYAVKPDSLSVDDVEGLRWVQQNVNIEQKHYNCWSLEEVRLKFWQFWEQCWDRCTMFADVTWPVESNFLSACIADDWPRRRWNGPYPLLDVASFLYASGRDGMGTFDRRPDELPTHNPLADARQSLQLLIESLTPEQIKLLESR